MSSQLKISADTSAVKKSILDIGKSMKDLKGTKVQVFSNEEKRFIKTEMKKEIGLIKQKLKENKAAIGEMVAEQRKLVSGTEEELAVRKKIIEAYKVQAKLAKQQGQLKNASKMGGSVDQAGGGMMGSIMAFARMIPGLAAVAAIGYGVTKSVQANDQYKAGAANRVKLKGLGVDDEGFGSPAELARVGLSEQDMIERRREATARLGRGAVSQEGEMRKAGFERAFGLEGGTMTGIATSLRGSFGGEGANDAQMKLQASVFAAGIEDAIGPYLESATQLLSAINENGMTQTSEITGLLAQMTKDGARTPEMIAKTFENINNAVKGATGESSAFLQTAFARAGIGGGTLGGTKFAMGSGGIMGLNREQLEKRGYNKDLLNNMESNGMFKGADDRIKAVMDQMRTSGGLKPGESISDVKDSNRAIGLGNLASSVLGIKDPAQAYDALMMMEKVQKGQMSGKQFDKKMKEMQEGNDPSLSRLDKINGTLAGQTTVLEQIRDNQMEQLGKEAVQIGNKMVALDTEGIVGVKNTTSALNASGATDYAGDAAVGAAKAANSGGLGGRAYNAIDRVKGWFGNSDADKMEAMTSDDAIVNQAKDRFRKGEAFKGYESEEAVEKKVRESLARDRLTAKDIGKEVANALKASPIVNKTNVKVQTPDKVTERTSK